MDRCLYISSFGSDFKGVRRIFSGQPLESHHASSLMFVNINDASQMEQIVSFLESICCEIQSGAGLGLAADGDVRQTGRADNAPIPELTRREKDVLVLLSKGCKYHEIASAFTCKVSTIQQHIKNLYNKLGVHSRSEAIHEAVQLGIISLEMQTGRSAIP